MTELYYEKFNKFFKDEKLLESTYEKVKEYSMPESIAIVLSESLNDFNEDAYYELFESSKEYLDESLGQRAKGAILGGMMALGGFNAFAQGNTVKAAPTPIERPAKQTADVNKAFLQWKMYGDENEQMLAEVFGNQKYTKNSFDKKGEPLLKYDGNTYRVIDIINTFKKDISQEDYQILISHYNNIKSINS
jgi:hypothetical protein